MGQGDCSSEGREGTEKPAVHFTRATDRQVRALVNDELGPKADSGRRRVRSVACSAKECTVIYEADEPVFSPESEMLKEQRPVWKRLFSDRQLRSATLVAYGTTQNAGGKESVSKALSLTCDRRAHREIDWEVVEVEGLKTLCDYQPFVNFD